MGRNSIRIVCNPYKEKLCYYFKNESGVWDTLSGDSPLFGQYYTNTSFFYERANEILNKMEEVYNRKNKGLDILFEGTDENYQKISKIIENNFTDRDITCNLHTTKIAVVGKTKAGKTSLIKGMEDLLKFKFQEKSSDSFTTYSDKGNNSEWYEVAGIDLDRPESADKNNEINKAFDTIKKLADKDLSTVIYCISLTSQRIENAEEELLKRLTEEFKELKVMIALTQCFGEDDKIRKMIDKLMEATSQMKVVPVLATDKKIKKSTIPSFGLPDVSQFVFGGR